MITQEEDFASCVAEMQPMIKELDEDVKMSRPLEVDWEGYCKLSEMGVVKLITARKDGALLGFCTIAISPNLHTCGETMALITGIFCPKKNRLLGVGNALLDVAEQKQRQYNWGELLIASRVSKPLDKLLARRRYTPQEIIFAKRIT
jgi:hypothetical protein